MKDLPAEKWETLPLGELCEFRRGLTYKKGDEVETGGTPVLRANNVDLAMGTLDLDEIRYIDPAIDVPKPKKVVGGSLLICTASGSKKHLGKTALIEDEMDFAFGGFMGLIVPHPRILPRYLQWLLRSDAYWSFIDGLSDGANINNLKFKQLAEFPVPLPTLEEQQRIVEVLDEAFEGLARARAHAEANLQNARELFESALGALFERDETASMQTVGALVDAGILDKPLDGNHGETHPKKADFVNSGIPFIMASDLKDGQVDQIGCHHITREQADSLRKGFAKDGDVLLSHKGTIGRTAILETDLDYVMLTPQVTYYRSTDQDKLSREYLYFAFQSGPFQKQIIEEAGGGATRAYIGITKQLDLKLPIPAIENQISLSKDARKIEACAKKALTDYEAKLEDLDDLRQSILQKAFAGDLT